MRERRWWWTEVWRFAAVLALAMIAGYLAGNLLASLLLITCGYVGWLLFSLFRLERWLRSGGKAEPPESTGIWQELYGHFHRLRQRHRKRKRKLAKIFERFQETAAAVPDATVVLDSGGEIEWFNDSAGRLLGLKGRDFGQRIGNLVRNPAFLRYLSTGQFADCVQFPSPLDEGLTLSARIIPYGRNQRLLIARDVTRLHKLEQMRRDFVANVSHELRTPITVIGGFLETMLDDEDECVRRWQRPLRQMHEQSGRMQRIVQDLLLLSRLETEEGPAKRDMVAVPAMLAAIREDAVSLSAERGHVIRADIDQSLWLTASEAELRSAFSNLVFNAVQYTPDGGEITVRWYCDEKAAYCEVQDTGEGIAPQHIPRLTERFYRVDVGRSRQSGGTGLGLAIVKHVLQRHQAKLEITSEPGKGSRFCCEFPSSLIMIMSGEQANA